MSASLPGKSSAGGLLGRLGWGLRLLLEMLRRHKRYPLTTAALMSGLRRVKPGRHIWAYESYLVVTRQQIERFLKDGWTYTEQRLALLEKVTDFPISPVGAERLVDLRKRMDEIRDGPFNQVVDAIYEDPLYPVFQHVGQAFRNQVSGRQPFVLRTLASLSESPRVICDVGCGSGILLGDVLERYPRAYGLGVDVSYRILHHARRVLEARGLGRQSTLVRADLRRLPHEEESISFTMAMEVLEHLPDPTAGARELARVLKPGGWLVTSVPVQDAAPVHLHVFKSVEEVIEVHTAAGLQTEFWHQEQVAPGVPNVLVASRKGEM